MLLCQRRRQGAGQVEREFERLNERVREIRQIGAVLRDNWTIPEDRVPGFRKLMQK